MHPTMRGLAVAVAVLAMGCGEATGPEVELDAILVAAPTELVLRYGEEKSLGVLRVAFVRVVEDSRCPIDVICVWEGNATVEIGLAVGMGPTFPLQLSTRLGPATVEWHDVSITLLEVQPAPRVSEPTRPEAYSIRLRLAPAR